MAKISYFNNVEDIKPKDYDLDEWLKMTIEPPEHLEKIIDEYRKSLLKKDKLKLPCVTISATFQDKRNLNYIKNRTGFIAIDIDRFSKSKKNTSNRCVDMLLVKELFMEHPCCYYAGFSCGGDGVYAVFRISPESELIDYFEHLKSSLSHIGLNIDNSCKDYTRLRFFSVDKEAYYNPDAKELKIRPKEPIKSPEVVAEGGEQKQEENFVPQTKERAIERLSNWDKAKKIVEICEQTGMDLTQSYEDWVKIGGALNLEFGEDGRGLFHRLSSFHPDYKHEDTDRKYNQCKKMNKIKFNTFLYIATSYGVRY